MDSRLKAFVDGHGAFRDVKFQKNKERFKNLADEGQHPKALFIGCSDSRVVPELITGSKPGDLFIIRNIGNFVAPFKPDADFHATASAIEYAVSILNVSDIIVCAHSHCGAIDALFTPIEKSDENIHTIKWLELGEAAKRTALLTYPEEGRDKEEMLRYTEKLSVVHQIDNLLTYPGVTKRVEEGSLYLHAWHYDIENGVIESYDDESYAFKPLCQT